MKKEPFAAPKTAKSPVRRMGHSSALSPQRRSSRCRPARR